MKAMAPIRYKCQECGWQTRQERSDNICPECGAEMQDMLKPVLQESRLWHEPVFDRFPCVLAHEYHRLFELSCSNNIYGVFLQLKDVIEATIKFIVLCAASWGKQHCIDDRENAYEKELANERMSLGDWVEIARLIQEFYKRSKLVPMPISLWKIISKLQKWVGDNQLVSWRNEKLGHGALGFDNDPAFQKEIADKIFCITDFYRANEAGFSALQIISDGNELTGYSKARKLSAVRGVCAIRIDDEIVDAAPYIMHTENGIFFFDELLKQKKSRMLSYPMGKTHLAFSDYTVRLADILRKQGSLLAASMESEIITRSENDFLAKLGCEGNYVEPKHLTSWLKGIVDRYSKGVFLLEMERGCGKTFFTERLNRRFNKNQVQIIADDLDVRTYHLSRTQVGGVKEFVNGIASEWSQSFEHKYDAVRSIVLEIDKVKTEQNAKNMTVFLGKWQQYTARSESRYRRQRIMLVLDGLDEIKERDEIIWSFIPRSEELPDNVYILLTGRNTETDALPNYYTQRVATLKTTDSKRISATSADNLSLLHSYIKSRKIPDITEEQQSDLIRMADSKILSLVMLCNMAMTDGIEDVTIHGLDKISRSYLSMIETHYIESRRPVFHKLLTILATIGEYEPISLRELADLLAMGTIRLDLLGMLADIAPLLSVERSYHTNENLYSDSNRYHFANTDISNAVREFLGTEVQLNLEELIRNSYSSNEQTAIEGSIVLYSHIADLSEKYKLYIDWHAEDLECIYSQSQKYLSQAPVHDGLVDLRVVSISQQVIMLCKNIDLDNREKAIDTILDAYFTQLSVPDFGSDGTRIIVVQEVFDIANKAQYTNEYSRSYNLCRVYTEMALTYGIIDYAEKAIYFAEHYHGEKTKEFTEAQMNAYKAYLCAEERMDYDVYEYHDRVEIAKKAVRLAENLCAEREVSFDSKYFEHFFNYGIMLETEAVPTNPKEARKYFNICIESLEATMKRKTASPLEQSQLVQVYSRLARNFGQDGNVSKAFDCICRGYDALKDIKGPSVFVSLRTLANFYLELFLGTVALKLNNERCSKFQIQIFKAAIELFDKQCALSTEARVLRSEFCIQTCPLFVSGDDNLFRSIDSYSYLLESVNTLENQYLNGSYQNSDNALEKGFGFLVMASYWNVCFGDGESHLREYIDIIERAIDYLEVFEEDEDEEERYLHVKVWMAKYKILGVLKANQNDDSVNESDIIDAIKMFMYLCRSQRFTQGAMEEMRGLYMQTLEEYIDCMQGQQHGFYVQYVNAAKASCSKRHISHNQYIAEKAEIEKLLRKGDTEQAIVQAESLAKASIITFGEKSHQTQDSFTLLRDGYRQLGNIESASNYAYCVNYLNVTERHAEAMSETFKIYLDTLTEAADAAGAQIKEKRERKRRAKEEAIHLATEELERKQKQEAEQDKYIQGKILEKAHQSLIKSSAADLEQASGMLQLAKLEEKLDNLVKARELFEQAIGVFEKANANDCIIVEYADAMYRYACFLSRIADPNANKIAMDTLTLYQRIALINTDPYYQTCIGHLSYEIASFFNRFGIDERAEEFYTIALEAYSKDKKQLIKVNKIKSWFQARAKLSLRGNLRCFIVSDFGGSETKKAEDFDTVFVMQQLGLTIELSREMLLTVIDTEKERDYFFRLLSRVNGRHVTFMMKEGGNYFDNKPSRFGWTPEAQTEAIRDGFRWAKVLDELGMSDSLYEKCVDKDALWVCEFFEKLLDYAKEKYSVGYASCKESHHSSFDFSGVYDECDESLEDDDLLENNNTMPWLGNNLRQSQQLDSDNRKNKLSSSAPKGSLKDKIQVLKSQGLTIGQVAKKLGLDYKTVNKKWN